MTDGWWTGVRERVEARPGDEVFGAMGHKWILDDPLTQDELADLERQADGGEVAVDITGTFPLTSI
ncbi:hypothetical protein ACFQ1S_33605, partial [Kibdelosporangium lantanae]